MYSIRVANFKAFVLSSDWQNNCLLVNCLPLKSTWQNILYQANNLPVPFGALLRIAICYSKIKCRSWISSCVYIELLYVIMHPCPNVSGGLAQPPMKLWHDMDQLLHHTEGPSAVQVHTWWQGSWGQHGIHLGPTGPRWVPYWPHEPCYQGCYTDIYSHPSQLLSMLIFLLLSYEV